MWKYSINLPEEIQSDQLAKTNQRKGPLQDYLQVHKDAGTSTDTHPPHPPYLPTHTKWHAKQWLTN